MSENKPEILLWTDIETTGLDPSRDKILEIGMLATDYGLKPLNERFHAIIRPRCARYTWNRMSQYARHMHMANGLLDEAAESKTNEKSAATSLSFWLDVQSESHKLVLAGSSVGQFDRKFLERLDPMYPERQAMEYTDHRVLDVSTLDKLAEKLYPDIWNQRPEKTTNHRVFACIEDSMRLYAYYREHLLPKLGARECN